MAKIKFIHLLLNPDNRQDIPQDLWESRISKQSNSINCWRRISHKFSSYVERYSIINRFEIPKENCAQPELVNYSKDLKLNPPVLSYGHWGAYKAHRDAILFEFSQDCDAVLIVEGDVVFDLNPEEMWQRIESAVEFSKSNNGSLLTFAKVSYGLGSRASVGDSSQDFGDYKKIDHFLCAQCYLVMSNERESIQNKLMNTGWHAWDIWMYWNYDCRVPIFSTKESLVYEPIGASMIDYVSKSNH